MNSFPKTKREAKSVGSKYYLTGKSCKRDHIDKRYTSSGLCVECRREIGEKHRKQDPEKTKKKARQAGSKYYKQNQEKITSRLKECRNQNRNKLNENARKWRKQNPGYHWKYNGIDFTIDDFKTMFEEQGSACKICKNTQKRLVVDHDHKTSEVRGLLCDACNTSLGKFNDDPALLEIAAAYLRKT